MSGSILALRYDTTTGKFLAGLIGAAQLDAGAVTSGKLGAGAVVSGIIAPGAIGHLNLFVDGLFTADATGRGKFANSFVNNSLVDTDINASKLGAGLLAHARISGLPYANLVLTNSLVATDITTNAVEEAKINALAITSGKVALASLATLHIRNQGILSASIGGTAIGIPHIAAAAIGSGLVADYGILSGKYASGSVTESALASGISIDIAETLSDPTYRVGEIVSSYQCLTIQSGVSKYVRIAKANDEHLMPAVGITGANAASGGLFTLDIFGRKGYDATRISGYSGSALFVGTDGYLAREGGAGFPSSSGNISQRMGEVVNDAVIDLKPLPFFVQIAE